MAFLSRVRVHVTNSGLYLLLLHSMADVFAKSKDWQWQLDVNLSSAFLCCKEVLPVMEKQGSGVVTVLSSIAGVGYIGKMHIGYSTTKAALVNFAKCTAMQYARKGIR